MSSKRGQVLAGGKVPYFHYRFVLAGRRNGLAVGTEDNGRRMVGRPWKRSQDFAGDQLAHRDLLAGVFPRQYLALSKETPWRVKEEMPLNGGQECGLGRPENEVIDDSRLL